MPQIGWFELLVIVIIAILVIGPKDFPVVLRKIGSWVSYIKKYFSEVQKEVSELSKITDSNNDNDKDKVKVKDNDDK